MYNIYIYIIYVCVYNGYVKFILCSSSKSKPFSICKKSIYFNVNKPIWEQHSCVWADCSDLATWWIVQRQSVQRRKPFNKCAVAQCIQQLYKVPVTNWRGIQSQYKYSIHFVSKLVQPKCPVIGPLYQLPHPAQQVLKPCSQGLQGWIGQSPPRIIDSIQLQTVGQTPELTNAASGLTALVIETNQGQSAKENEEIGAIWLCVFEDLNYCLWLHLHTQDMQHLDNSCALKHLQE